jgi:hypothetical protein
LPYSRPDFQSGEAPMSQEDEQKPWQWSEATWRAIVN